MGRGVPVYLGSMFLGFRVRVLWDLGWGLPAFGVGFPIHLWSPIYSVLGSPIHLGWGPPGFGVVVPHTFGVGSPGIWGCGPHTFGVGSPGIWGPPSIWGWGPPSIWGGVPHLLRVGAHLGSGSPPKMAFFGVPPPPQNPPNPTEPPRQRLQLPPHGRPLC